MTRVMTEHAQSMPFVIFQQAMSFVVVFALSIIGMRASGGDGIRGIPTTTGGMVLYFLVAFVMTTFLLLLFLRTARGAALFSVLFAVAIFAGVGTLTVTLFGTGVGIALTSVAVLAYYLLRVVFLFNMILLVGLAGVAVSMGESLNAVAVVILLGILAVYDVIAVYGTKHMVVMGKELLQHKVFFGLVIPGSPRDLLKRLEDITPHSDFVFLGTGDVVLPALLVATTARYGTLEAVFPAAGALVGLMLTTGLFFTKSHKRPMPALPPIALGAILGYIFTILL